MASPLPTMSFGFPKIRATSLPGHPAGRSSCWLRDHIIAQSIRRWSAPSLVVNEHVRFCATLHRRARGCGSARLSLPPVDCGRSTPLPTAESWPRRRRCRPATDHVRDRTCCGPESMRRCSRRLVLGVPGCRTTRNGDGPSPARVGSFDVAAVRRPPARTSQRAPEMTHRLLVEDVCTSSVSKTLQLSFSKPLHTTGCDIRLRAFRGLWRSTTYCSRTGAFLFPAIACISRPRAAPPLLAKKRREPRTNRLAFADQRSWLVAFRRAQHCRIYFATTSVSRAIMRVQKKSLVHVIPTYVTSPNGPPMNACTAHSKFSGAHLPTNSEACLASGRQSLSGQSKETCTLLSGHVAIR
jgi:hypothetical protein